MCPQLSMESGVLIKIQYMICQEINFILPLCPTASLRLSPDRSQYFKYESVFLSCEDRQSDSTVWTVKRTIIQNITSECDGDWGKMNTTGCLVRSMRSSDSAVYWCESSEEQSNTVNITVTGMFSKSTTLFSFLFSPLLHLFPTF